FDMEVIAWSQNLTAEAAGQFGVERVEKDELFRRSDVLSLHLVLAERTRGIVGARELGLMKPTAILINTARGPIVDEGALIAALREGRIAGAGLDVYEREPLPDAHPLRTLPNVVLTRTSVTRRRSSFRRPIPLLSRISSHLPRASRFGC